MIAVINQTVIRESKTEDLRVPSWITVIGPCHVPEQPFIEVIYILNFANIPILM